LPQVLLLGVFADLVFDVPVSLQQSAAAGLSTSGSIVVMVDIGFSKAIQVEEDRTRIRRDRRWWFSKTSALTEEPEKLEIQIEEIHRQKTRTPTALSERTALCKETERGRGRTFEAAGSEGNRLAQDR
jgi:hypothetical protein